MHVQKGNIQVVLVVKNLLTDAADIRDAGSIPGLGRSPGGGHGDPLHYSCQENPMENPKETQLSVHAHIHGIDLVKAF